MKHYLIFILASLTLLFAGCKKRPIDNQMEGMWKLESFTTLSDGEIHPCERLYYSITRYVVEVSEKQGSHGYGIFIARFEYGEGRKEVSMTDFKQRQYTSDNGVDATVEDLLPFGMNATSTTFRVKEAKGKKLVLESDYATLYFTKF